MQDVEFMEAVKEICRKDRRYDREAYAFVREALDFTSKNLNKPREGSSRHVSGGELLEGIRKYAVQEFGPMTLTVLHSWGIKKTEDFGEIVFNLISVGKLGKTDEDRKEHFANGYDFYEVFARPYLPASEKNPARAPRRKSSRRRKPTERKAS